jgi:hypothetical protein
MHLCSAIFFMAYMTQMYSTETHTDTHQGKMTSGTHRRPQRLSQVAMYWSSMTRCTNIRLFFPAVNNWLHTHRCHSEGHFWPLLIMVLMPSQITPTVLILRCQLGSLSRKVSKEQVFNDNYVLVSCLPPPPPHGPPESEACFLPPSHTQNRKKFTQYFSSSCHLRLLDPNNLLSYPISETSHRLAHAIL